MNKITTDFVGTETDTETVARLTDILEFWGYDPSSYTAWGDARADLNAILAGTAAGGVGLLETASSFLPKINLANDPEQLLEQILFANGELGEFWAPSPGQVFIDTARTSPAAAGQAGANATGLFRGLHASQATVAFRPIFGREPEGGARNRLVRTEEFDNTAWVKTAAGTGGAIAPVVTPNAGLDPNGNMTADRVVFNCVGNLIGDRSSILQSLSGFTIGQAVRFSVWIRATSPEEVGKQLRVAGDGVLTSTIITISADWQRFVITGTVSSSTGQNVLIETRGTFTSNATADVLIWGAQLETGTTATAYQRVGAAFDVTEAGKPDRWFLRRDPTDDALVATLPDLGSNATRAFVTDAGVTIQTGQTIGAGPYDILRAERLFGHLVINRPLTATETERVTRYLERLAP